MSDLGFSPSTTKATVRGLCLVALMLFTAALAYLPGLTGGFAFDDYPNILHNSAITDGDMSLGSLAQVAWSGAAGPLKRPIAMLSFALNYHSTGHSPLAFKVVNLIIHLVNGLLVLWLAGLILRARANILAKPHNNQLVACALAIGAIWVIHPINLTSVLYVVQRMNSLAAGFSLLAMICYCIGRFRIISGSARGSLLIYFGFPMCITLGALCKENAMLTLPLAAVVESCFFRFRAHSRRDRICLALFLAVIVLIPSVFVCVFLFNQPEWLITRYDSRPFSLVERVLTESRVIWFYVSLVFFPRIGDMGLFHDDFALSVGLFQPTSTIIAVIATVAVVATALASIRRFPMFAFGVLWFGVGHLMESTVLPLELVHEHRNYLPSVGLILGSAVGVVEFSNGVSTRWLPSVVTVCIFLLLGMLTFFRAGDWSDPITLATIEAKRNPRSFRAVYELGRIRYTMFLMGKDEQDYSESIAILEHSLTLDPGAKRPLVELIRLSSRHGGIPKPQWERELVRRYAESPFHGSERSDLNNLVNCRLSGNCQFPPSLLVETYSAALSNSTVSADLRVHLMADLAILYVYELGDFKLAIALLDDAIKLRPRNFNFSATRIDILILYGHFDEARRALDLLNRNTRWEDHAIPLATRIAELERKLRDGRASNNE